jgi:hypothetical protein
VGSEQQRNISIALLVLTGLILFLFQKQGDKLPLAGLVALAVIAGITFIFPLAGMALAICIFAVAWFDHSQAVWTWWEGIKKTTLNIGGKK